MNYRWVIDGNHLALKCDNYLLHPTSEEIYSLIEGNKQNTFTEDISNPVNEMEEVRFSKIGSPLKCELLSSEDNKIYIILFAIRKGEKIPVDIVDGTIIDHCCVNGEWFYLNGDILTLQQLLSDAGVSANGEISVKQYIELVKQEIFYGYHLIENHVNPEVISKILNKQGSIPDSVSNILFEYQKTGFCWMINMLEAGNGCILGDEMGLGKTLQVITVFEELKDKGRKPMLVVAPVSLLENWKRECLHFTSDLDVYIHHGSQRTGRPSELQKHDVVVISYNTAVTDLSLLKMINWVCVVLDEAQYVKNPGSERAKAVKAIKRQNSIAITGTPFENHITDIWSLVDFVMPGLLGTLSSFKRNVSDDVLGAEKVEPIISPIMIRRLVKDVANDLPEKVIIPQAIIMSESERKAYERYRQQAKSDVDGGSSITIAVLQKMRMYCAHKWLCDEENEKDPYEASIKYQRFCEILEEIVSKNEKVIVFTSYKKMFDIFKNDIPNRYGIEVKSINGETPVNDRQAIVDWLNGYEGSAMLVLNPKAAGVGLNITGANHVIHYNLEWNPALEDQSSARAYRRGQTKTVFIYRLFYANTVEQIVNERIERKREMASAAVVGTDGSEERNDIIRALEMAPELF